MGTPSEHEPPQWVYTDTLRALMDATDARGAKGCTVSRGVATWSITPWRPAPRIIETCEVWVNGSDPITVEMVISEQFNVLEMFLLALGKSGPDSFHFHAPVAPSLLVGTPPQRLVPGFTDRVDAHIRYLPEPSLRLLRSHPVEVQAINPHPLQYLPPLKVRDYRRSLPRNPNILPHPRPQPGQPVPEFGWL